MAHVSKSGTSAVVRHLCLSLGITCLTYSKVYTLQCSPPLRTLPATVPGTAVTSSSGGLPFRRARLAYIYGEYPGEGDLSPGRLWCAASAVTFRSLCIAQSQSGSDPLINSMVNLRFIYSRHKTGYSRRA